MTYFFYALIGLALIVFQTAVVPSLTPSHVFYDALIPFIIYLGVFRPGRGAFVFVIALGLMMDGMSGGPVGVYLITYLWLFGGVRCLDRIFRMRNGFVLLVILVLGVCLENIVCVVSIFLSGQKPRMLLFPVQAVGLQIFWMVFTGLILIKILNALQKLWNQWCYALHTEKTDVL